MKELEFILSLVIFMMLLSAPFFISIFTMLVVTTIASKSFKASPISCVIRILMIILFSIFLQYYFIKVLFII
jgi:hypothetical protein